MFEVFWAAYPRRIAKFKARTAFDKALKHSTAEEIIAGARRYAKEREGQDPQFTKHPATWLNGGCWEDEPTEGFNVKRSVVGAFERLAETLAGPNDYEGSATDLLSIPGGRLLGPG